jgi:hypothetical protein
VYPVSCIVFFCGNARITQNTPQRHAQRNRMSQRSTPVFRVCTTDNAGDFQFCIYCHATLNAPSRPPLRASGRERYRYSLHSSDYCTVVCGMCTVSLVWCGLQGPRGRTLYASYWISNSWPSVLSFICEPSRADVIRPGVYLLTERSPSCCKSSLV